MKKLFLLFILFFIFTIWVNANSGEIDFNTDYTLIDCINWNNDTWSAFDNSKPYATLKEGIENTVNYINTNVNKIWNEETASWKLFTIQVECSFDDIFNKSIALNFNWVDYNNELLIEWINDNSFIIKETNFNLWHKAWNITFKNAQFRNENKAYFNDYLNTF